jgi:hypothetical protein
MRVMMKLRALGLPLAEARRAAEEAAPGVVWAALVNHRDKALAVDAPRDLATEYLKALEKNDDAYLIALADFSPGEHGFHYALIENGQCLLLSTLDEDTMSEDVEVGGLINLWGVARAIVEAAMRPLFTLVVPKGFRAE